MSQIIKAFMGVFLTLFMWLCEALTLMKEQLSEDESELFALADSVLRKVSAMDDAAFEKLNLYPD